MLSRNHNLRPALVSQISVQLTIPRIVYKAQRTLQPMKAVPSVLCSLGNCTAGFPQVAPCLSLQPMKGAKLVARYVYSCFSWNCAWTDLPNYEHGIPVCETGTKTTKVGGWLQSLSYTNWISVNELRIWLMQIHDKLLKLNFFC